MTELYSCNKGFASGAVILLKKMCPYCEEPFNRFQNMKRHIFNIHGKDITVSRSKKDHGKSAHGIPTHVYNTNNVKKCKENITIIIKVSCPGCRDTFDTVSGLAHHVDDIHIKISPSLENLPKEKTMFLRWSGYFKQIPRLSSIVYSCVAYDWICHQKPLQRTYGYAWYPCIPATKGRL